MNKKPMGTPKRGPKRIQMTIKLKEEAIKELNELQRRIFNILNAPVSRTRIIESLIKKANQSEIDGWILQIISENA